MSFRYFCAIRRLSLQGNQAKILGGISAQQVSEGYHRNSD
jgi:hypothetical protein